MYHDCLTSKDTSTTKPVDDQQRSKVKAHVYAVIGRDEEASKAIVLGTISLFAYPTCVFIDLGSTHSFISYAYARHASSLPVMLDYVLHVSTSLGKSFLANLVFQSCAIMVGDLELLVNLILLDIKDFDVILGMDWLTVIANFYFKEVVFHILRIT